MSKINVLIISFEYPPYADGGLAVHTEEIFKELQHNQDIEIKLIVAKPSNRKIINFGNNVEQIEVPFHNIRGVNYLIFSLRIYFRYIFLKSNQYDIVHALSLFSYLCIPRPAKCKFILTCHNTLYSAGKVCYFNFWKDILFRKLYYKLLIYWEDRLSKKCDRIITVSNSTKADLCESYGINSKKISVIYNGINLKKFGSNKKNFNSKRAIRKLLFVGRIVPRKNIETLIKSIAFVKEHINDIQLTICGKGKREYEIELKKLVKKNNLQNNIIFTGFIHKEGLINMYVNSDLFVFPSLVEGFGMVLTEAMSFGIPVIATNIGGVNDVVRDDKEGILVEPRNPSKMAKAIIRVIRDKQLYSKLQKNALRRVGDFSWKTSANELVKCYRQVVHGDAMR